MDSKERERENNLLSFVLFIASPFTHLVKDEFGIELRV